MDPIALKRPFGPVNCCTPCDASGPHVDLTFDEGQEPDIPQSGKITFRFTRKRKVEDDSDETCNFVLCLDELLDVQAEEAPKAAATAEIALDKLAKDLTGRSSYD